MLSIHCESQGRVLAKGPAQETARVLVSAMRRRPQRAASTVAQALPWSMGPGRAQASAAGSARAADFILVLSSKCFRQHLDKHTI